MAKTLFVDNTTLSKDKKFTYLSATATNATSSLTVQSTVGIAINQQLLIGDIGQEKSEIIATHAIQPVSGGAAGVGTVINLASAMSFDHPQDVKVSFLDWNRAEFSWSATATGAKTVLSTQNIQPDQPETLYRDTAQTTGFYFVRFNESIGATFSDYSDPVPFAGYDDNTVFMIKKRALDSVKEKIDTNLITHEYLNQSLWQGRREYHQMPGKRPFRRKYNNVIGTVSTGIYRISLPIDTEKPFTAENIYGVRIGIQPNMSWYDKKMWDIDYQGSSHSVITNAAGYTVGDKDLYVTDTRNFTVPSGSVIVEDDTIAYSAVGVSSTAGTLRISTQGKFNHPTASDVWQGIASGMPSNFTVFADPGGSAFIYFSSPVSTVYVNQDIFCDYYRTIVDQDSDADVLDEPNYDMFVPYLAHKIKQRKSRGELPVARSRTGATIADPDYLKWIELRNQSIASEYAGVEIRIAPSVGHLPIPS